MLSKTMGLTGSILIILVAFLGPGMCEIDYFPGLRRPPPVSNWAQSQTDESSFLLAQLTNIIEEQARRRFQQQLSQQHYYHQVQDQRGPKLPDDHNGKPSFTYQFPEQKNNVNDNGPILFAVTPGDHRFYENNTNTAESNYLNMDTEANEKINFVVNGNSEMINKMPDEAPYSKLKAPMDVNPKPPVDNNNNIIQNTIAVRDDLTALVKQLQRNGHVNTIINEDEFSQKNDVVKKPLGLDGTMRIYLVALIAGVSAALTVGLIALGVGWYTLHKRAKAAADVEYPAYGVTGPNKDISPSSGDRRLAQSAQMYHYQHQKQQIIAMENQSGNENQVGISDVESDDDNEEGDYTVYECPGLAPTGEMEVKNPLFIDDTPVTPSSSNITDGQTQSPVQSVRKDEKLKESTSAGLVTKPPKN